MRHEEGPGDSAGDSREQEGRGWGGRVGGGLGVGVPQFSLQGGRLDVSVVLPVHRQDPDAIIMGASKYQGTVGRVGARPGPGPEGIPVDTWSALWAFSRGSSSSCPDSSHPSCPSSGTNSPRTTTTCGTRCWQRGPY